MSTKQLQPIANALRNALERHLIDILLRCLRKASHVFLTHFFKFKKKNFLILFTYFLLSYIWSKRCHNVKFPTWLIQKM